MQPILRAAGAALVFWAAQMAGAGADDVVPSDWGAQKRLWQVYGAEKKFVPVEGRSCPEALQIKVPGKGANPWDSQAKLDCQIPIDQDDLIVITFEARVVDGASGELRLLFKEHTAPYRSSFEKSLTLASEWQHYVAAGKSHASFSAAAAQVEFHLGFQAQTLQIAGLKVERSAGKADAPPAAAGDGSARPAGYYAALAELLGSAGKGRFIVPDSEDGVMAKLSCAATRAEDIRPVGVPFVRARRAIVKEKTQEFWKAHVAIRNVSPVRAGELLYCTFWARRGQAPEVPSDAPARIEVHLKQCEPFVLLDDLKTSVGDQWTRYALLGKVDRDYGPGQIEVIVCLGSQPQVVEVGGMALAAFAPGANTARLPQSPNSK